MSFAIRLFVLVLSGCYIAVHGAEEDYIDSDQYVSIDVTRRDSGKSTTTIAPRANSDAVIDKVIGKDATSVLPNESKAGSGAAPGLRSDSLFRYPSVRSGRDRAVPVDCGIDLLFASHGDRVIKQFTPDWLKPVAVKFLDHPDRCMSAYTYFRGYDHWPYCSSYIMSRYGAEIHKQLDDMYRATDLEHLSFFVDCIVKDMSSVSAVSLPAPVCQYTDGDRLTFNDKSYWICYLLNHLSHVLITCMELDGRGVDKRELLVELKKCPSTPLLDSKDIQGVDDYHVYRVVHFDRLYQCSYLWDHVGLRTCKPIADCGTEYTGVMLSGLVTISSFCSPNFSLAPRMSSELMSKNEETDYSYASMLLYNPYFVTREFDTIGEEKYFVSFHCWMSSLKILRMEVKTFVSEGLSNVIGCGVPIVVTSGISIPSNLLDLPVCTIYNGFYYVDCDASSALCYRVLPYFGVSLCRCKPSCSKETLPYVYSGVTDFILDIFGYLLPAVHTAVKLITTVILGVFIGLVKAIWSAVSESYDSIIGLVPSFSVITDYAIPECVFIYNLCRLRYNRFVAVLICFVVFNYKLLVKS